MKTHILGILFFMLISFSANSQITPTENTSVLNQDTLNQSIKTLPDSLNFAFSPQFGFSQQQDSNIILDINPEVLGYLKQRENTTGMPVLNPQMQSNMPIHKPDSTINHTLKIKDK